ncbi:beta-galactosidase [Actinoalloteichus caeruleus]|uniref:beta-galactosidase n=1 Tax=Actinoalloteichus cyanogriseus TaxID=2893586 RepID=UPI0004AA1137|nr:beta-galactosidase [Actinoalloteichus caeruleus]
MPGLAKLTRGRLAYGGDYNPEQWPEEVWAEDVALMREAGVTVVTVGVFAWSWLEPSPGAREFGWLDRVLDLLHEGGVAVNLATPTATPPPWMAHRHPETVQVAQDGRRMAVGSRNHFCPSSPTYRRYAEAIVRDLADRYADHPALRMWHAKNEYCETCHCDVSAQHFRRWLRTRYADDLDALNAAWTTAFWSQRYGDWDEIGTPRDTTYLRNPTQQLDFRRFSSDALLECFTLERDLLRRRTPDVPITTNFPGLATWVPVDYRRFAAEEDVVSLDWYPDPGDENAHVSSALAFDLMRSLAGGRPWALMEQAAAAINWRGRNPTKPGGLTRVQSLQAVARGADVVCFFQWRASTGGAEKFHSGMVPHSGPDSRIFTEIRDLGADLARLSEVVGRTERARVACVLSWESWWAASQEAHPSNDLDVLDQLHRYYEPLNRLGLTVDVVAPDADLTAYALVVVPNLYLVRDDEARAIVDYTRSGGHVVLGFFSGIVDEFDRVRTGGYPAPFLDLLGLRVEEFCPQPEGTRVRCASAEFGDFSSDLWVDRTRPTTAEPVAAVRGGELDGVPVILRNRHGTGLAWYVGTRPDQETLRRLVAAACARAGVDAPAGPLPPGVEVVRRAGLLFLLNHRDRPAEITVAGSWRDVLTGAGFDDRISLPGHGALVLRPNGGRNRHLR